MAPPSSPPCPLLHHHLTGTALLFPSPLTGPSAPRNVTVRIIRPLLVEIRWRAPAVSNGQIIRYTVYAIPIAVFGPAIRKRQAAPNLPSGTIKQVCCTCIYSGPYSILQRYTYSGPYTILQRYTYNLCVVMYAPLYNLCVCVEGISTRQLSVTYKSDKPSQNMVKSTCI